MTRDWINEGADPYEDIDPFNELVGWIAAQFRSGNPLNITTLAQRAHATREYERTHEALYSAMVALTQALDDAMIAPNDNEPMPDITDPAMLPF